MIIASLGLNFLSAECIRGKHHEMLKQENKGLAQGSPLSPILFNIYCNEIGNFSTENVKILKYADDFALLGVGNKPEDLINEINNIIAAVTDWLEDHGLTISPHKTQAILLGKRNLEQRVRNIVISNQNIEWKEEVTYLSMSIDKELKGKSQIHKNIVRAENGINLIKSLSGTWVGAYSAILLIFD